MSLQTLPVSLDDILNLQRGIEFQTNTAEATLEVSLINAGTQTVFQYANQLLLNMLPLSQVVMAVDSLMSGAVQSEAEMTNFTVNFVPGQLAFFNALPPATQAGAGGAIVWDAEVTGFALTTRAAFTTNFAGLNTGANAGAAGDAAFAAAVSTAIFGNTSLTTQVLAFLHSFETFLINNPSELTGNGLSLSDLVKAADALTFGTEVGIALSNIQPGQVGAFLEAQVTNALLANADFLNGNGPSPVGVALGLVPPHNPLQGEVPSTFTLTVNQDTAITGQPFNGTGPVVPASNVLINAPLVGTQATLTNLDTIQLSGNGNSLNAFFDNPAPDTVSGLTIKGVQTWTFQNIGSGVTIDGGANVGGPGPVGGAGNPGVQTITYQGSTDSLQVGAGGAGIQNVISTLNVLNDSGTNTIPLNLGSNVPFVAVIMNGALFNATSALTVNINHLTSTVGNWYAINAGGTAGAAGYVTWNLHIQDSQSLGGGVTGDKIVLGSAGATSATTINVSDVGGATGGLLLNATSNGGGPAQWANVTTINGTGLVGALKVSGAEGAFAGVGTGFLAANNKLTSITTTGTAGTQDLFVDLTSMNAAGAANLTAINAGAGLGEVAFNNTVLTTAAVNLTGKMTNIDILDDASAAIGGTIDMSHFPLVAGAVTINGKSMSELHLLAADGTTGTAHALVGALAVTNGFTNFNVNLDNTDMNGQNVTIGVASGQLNGGVDELAVNLSATGTLDTLTVNNYTTLDLVASAGGTDNVTTLVDNPFIGTTGIVNISGAATVNLGDIAGGVEGTSTVSINGGGTTTIHDTDAGQVTLGVTNAHLITVDNGAAQLFMQAPGTDISGDFHVTLTTASGGGSLLQGSLGAVTLIGSNVAGGSNFSGPVGNDVITGNPTAAGDAIFGDGGADTIHLGTGNVFGVFVGEYAMGNPAHATFTGLNPDGLAGFGGTNIVIQEITDGGDLAYQGFWGIANGTGPTAISGLGGVGSNFGTSADLSVVSGFNAATTNNFVGFAADAWQGGFAGSGALHDLNGAVLTSPGTSNGTTAPLWSASAGAPGAGTDVLLYDLLPGNLSGAQQLANDLSAIAPITLGAGAIAAGTDTHILVAYQSAANGGGVTIADVDIINPGAATNSTLGLTVKASDMVELTGISLATLQNGAIHIV